MAKPESLLDFEGYLLHFDNYCQYIFKSLGDMIIIVDESLKIRRTMVNKSETAVFAMADALDSRLGMNMPEEASSVLLSLIGKSLADKLPRENEIILNENNAHLLYRVFPIKNRLDQVLGALIIIDDITQKKRIEGDLANREYDLINRNKQLEIINMISSIINQNLPIEDVVRQTLVKTLEALSLAAGGIYLYDRERKQFYLSAQQGLPLSFIEKIGIVPENDPDVAKLVRFSKPVLIEEFFAPFNPLISAIREYKLGNIVSFVLKSKDKVLGIMNMVFSSHKPDKNDMLILDSIGRELSIAIASAISYADLQKKLSELEEFQDVAVGRELKMIALEKEIEGLKSRLNGITKDGKP